MNNSKIDSQALAEEREEIVRSARLHWFHWLVVSLSLLLTLGAWYFTKQQVDEKTADRFKRESHQVLELVSDRMKRYEDGLWGGVSAIQAHGGDISYEDWLIFADSLRIDIKYPGINGIGVIHHVKPDDLAAYLRNQRRSRPSYHIHPEHPGIEFLPITYIEPSDINAKAVGLDMAHENNRYTAALRARDTGSAQITGPIVLVQDNSHTPGFLFYAPFFKAGTHDSVEKRRETFTGLVYAPFVFHKLIDGLLEKGKRKVLIRVTDLGDVLYDELVSTEGDYDPNPLFSTKAELNIYGRRWSFDIATTQAFREESASDQPMIILIGGILIDSLLLTLFVLLSRSNRKAINFADRMTRELEKKAHALERSNEELEKFAYVASHDLKTPLRGIGDLTEYLEEDLVRYMDEPNSNPDIKKNIGRLHQQTHRMENLINGILVYSSIGGAVETFDTVETANLVSTLQTDLNLREDQVVMEGDFPVLKTNAVRLEQVLANIMGNAKKYHHDPDNALLTISVTDAGKFYCFTIADNGPGIDPRFHKRMFEAFQALQSKDEIESTGIGLSIVKKAVERYGGIVSVSSDLGKGATISFEWPKDIEVSRQHTIAA